MLVRTRTKITNLTTVRIILWLLQGQNKIYNSNIGWFY